MLRLFVAIAVCSCLLLMGCGSPQAPDLPPPEAKAKPEPKEDKPRDRIYRVELEHVLRLGPPEFLSRVDIEEVMVKDEFVGWRVRALPREWKDIELQPGDVVTAVNAMPLRTPNEMFSAWTTLSVASELKVSYTRDGKEHVMSYPIDGTPDPNLSKRLSEKPKDAEEPDVRGNQRYNAPKRKNTIVISGDDRPLSDTNTDWSD